MSRALLERREALDGVLTHTEQRWRAAQGAIRELRHGQRIDELHHRGTLNFDAVKATAGGRRIAVGPHQAEGGYARGARGMQAKAGGGNRSSVMEPARVGNAAVPSLAPATS